MADENTDVEELDEEAAGKGKGKLFLIIGIVVLILIGAAGAFFFLSGDDEAAEDEVTEAVVEEDEGEKIALYHAVPKPKEPGMTIIMQPGTGYKQAQISFRIFSYSPDLVDYLVKNDPMIRHHILNTLSLQDPQLFISKAGREKMQQALKQTLVDLLQNSQVEEEQKLSNKVEAVYFTTFILQ